MENKTKAEIISEKLEEEFSEYYNKLDVWIDGELYSLFKESYGEEVVVLYEHDFYLKDIPTTIFMNYMQSQDFNVKMDAFSYYISLP